MENKKTIKSYTRCVLGCQTHVGRGWGKVWQILVEHIPFRISPLMTLALPSYVPINFSHLLLVWLGSEVRCGEYLLSISHSEYLLWWPSPWLAFPHMFWPFNLLTFYWLGRAVRQGVANACWEYLVQNISFDGPRPTIILSYVPFNFLVGQKARCGKYCWADLLMALSQEHVSFRISLLMALAHHHLVVCSLYWPTHRQVNRAGHDATRYKVEHLECVRFDKDSNLWIQLKVSTWNSSQDVKLNIWNVFNLFQCRFIL